MVGPHVIAFWHEFRPGPPVSPSADNLRRELHRRNLYRFGLEGHPPVGQLRDIFDEFAARVVASAPKKTAIEWLEDSSQARAMRSLSSILMTARSAGVDSALEWRQMLKSFDAESMQDRRVARLIDAVSVQVKRSRDVRGYLAGLSDAVVFHRSIELDAEANRRGLAHVGMGGKHAADLKYARRRTVTVIPPAELETAAEARIRQAAFERHTPFIRRLCSIAQTP